MLNHHRHAQTRPTAAAQARHDVDAAFNWLVGADRAFFRQADRAVQRLIGFTAFGIERALRAAQRPLAGTPPRARRKPLPPPVRVWPRG